MSFPTLLKEVGGGRSHCSLLREEEERGWQHKHFLPFLLLLFCLMCEDVSRHSPQHPMHQGLSPRTGDTASSVGEFDPMCPDGEKRTKPSSSLFSSGYFILSSSPAWGSSLDGGGREGGAPCSGILHWRERDTLCEEGGGASL